MIYDFAVNNAIIMSPSDNWEPRFGSVGVKQGRIAVVAAENISADEAAELVDARGSILMPGLVNAHCHGDMTLARGLGDDLTLAEQNTAFADSGWFFKWITDEDRIASRQLTYCEALLSGTTFILENMYWGLGTDSARIMAETGIRGAIAEDIRKDFYRPDEFLSDAELREIREACDENGIVFVLAGISEEDYDADRLQRIYAVAKRHQAIQTCHLAENDWRLELVRKKFDCGSVELLHRLEVLNSGLIGSHVIYLNDEEIGYLAASKTSVANTVLCEMKIADGVAPIPKMVKAGVNVCLGTDGAMWNNSNDIFREMKGMALLHTVTSGIRSLSVKDILNMATINGAKAFHAGDDFGSIEAGKSADFILVRTDGPHMQPMRTGAHENVSSNLVYNATGRDVTDVFVRGRRVVNQGKLQTMDVAELIRKNNIISDRIAGSLL